MNEQNFHTQANTVNLLTMSKDDITKLRGDCDKELEKRHKEEVKEFKAETKRKAEQYGLVIKVQAKK